MTLELDMYFLKYEPTLSIGQLVFLGLVKNDIKMNHQDVSTICSLISETEIQDLVNRNLITVESTRSKKIYNLSKELLVFIKGLPEVKSMFDEFYETYPSYITRTDGMKDYLRSNKVRCRTYYETLVGSSREMHEHIMNCLKFEVSQKLATGKIGYMKRMWKWLTSNEWEIYDEQMKEETKPTVESKNYGTEIL